MHKGWLVFLVVLLPGCTEPPPTEPTVTSMMTGLANRYPGEVWIWHAQDGASARLEVLASEQTLGLPGAVVASEALPWGIGRLDAPDGRVQAMIPEGRLSEACLSLGQWRDDHAGVTPEPWLPYPLETGDVHERVTGPSGGIWGADTVIVEEVRVLGPVELTVPAGTFLAHRIEARSWLVGFSADVQEAIVADGLDEASAKAGPPGSVVHADGRHIFRWEHARGPGALLPGLGPLSVPTASTQRTVVELASYQYTIRSDAASEEEILRRAAAGACAEAWDEHRAAAWLEELEAARAAVSLAVDWPEGPVPLHGIMLRASGVPEGPAWAVAWSVDGEAASRHAQLPLDAQRASYRAVDLAVTYRGEQVASARGTVAFHSSMEDWVPCTFQQQLQRGCMSPPLAMDAGPMRIQGSASIQGLATPLCGELVLYIDGIEAARQAGEDGGTIQVVSADHVDGTNVTLRWEGPPRAGQQSVVYALELMPSGDAPATAPSGC